MELEAGPLYSEAAVARGIDVTKADYLYAATPYKVQARNLIEVYKEVKKRDADFYKRLEAVGFMHDFGDDEFGLHVKYIRRGSGYYIDVGASDLVCDGKIKLKSRVEVKEIKPKSVLLSDGTELKADLIVYATGYGPMNGWAAELISQEVADKVGKCWGLGTNTTKDPGPYEGEPRNMWKPTHQENLWFHGGNLHQSRFWSQFVALQVKARMEGIEDAGLWHGEGASSCVIYQALHRGKSNNPSFPRKRESSLIAGRTATKLCPGLRRGDGFLGWQCADSG